MSALTLSWQGFRTNYQWVLFTVLFLLSTEEKKKIPGNQNPRMHLAIALLPWYAAHCDLWSLNDT